MYGLQGALNGTSWLNFRGTFQTRYLFLDRAGLYKHPSAKALGTSKSAFPLISEVAGGTDEEFLVKVTIVSAEDSLGV